MQNRREILLSAKDNNADLRMTNAQFPDVGRSCLKEKPRRLLKPTSSALRRNFRFVLKEPSNEVEYAKDDSRIQNAEPSRHRRRNPAFVPWNIEDEQYVQTHNDGHC